MTIGPIDVWRRHASGKIDLRCRSGCLIETLTGAGAARRERSAAWLRPGPTPAE